MGVAGGLTRTAVGALSRHGGRPTAAAAALLLYLGVALVVTWPWAADPAGVTFGVTYGDLGSHIGTPAAWAREGAVPWLPSDVAALDAPEGLPMQWALNLAAAPSLTLLTLLAAAAGPVAANGIWVVSGLALTAWAMFLLARRLTGRVNAALVAGLAFGFWPYAYATVSQPLGHGWVLVLVVWRMLELLERPTVRNGAWAGAAAALAMWWIQYWLLIAGVLWLSLAAAALVVAARRGALRRAARAHAVAAAPVALLLVGLAVAGLASGFQGVPERAEQDPALYSARPAMYLVPGPHNPVVGDRTGPWLAERFRGDGSSAFYNPIYIGLSVLLLAGAGAAVVVRRRGAGRRPVAGVAACAAAGAVALLMSAPPRVDLLGVRVPLPSALVAEITTTFRTSARFAHVVMLALCVLAAVGTATLLRDRRAPAAAALTLLIGAVVFADLWGRDPTIGAPQRVNVPATVRALEALPRGVTATYPLLPAPSDRSGPLYTAAFHGQPVFNAYRQGTPSETRKLGLAHLTQAWVPRELAAYGVRYVLVEAATAATGGLPAPGGDVAGLRRITADDYATLYEVVARPAPDVALARDGFSFVQGAGPTALRLMTAPTGLVELRSDCGGCRRVLRLGVSSVARPRSLVVRDARGAVLLRTTVPVAPITIAVPVRVRGTEVVSLTVDPPPEPVPGDYREAGILVNVRLRLGPPRPTPAGPGPGGLARRG